MLALNSFLNLSIYSFLDANLLYVFKKTAKKKESVNLGWRDKGEKWRA
jgi:hypothetical protein